MTDISIVVPAYAVEAYLPKCLDSILASDIHKSRYEVIVVNDGSPDGCLAIANSYAELHQNIAVVDQPNGGLGNARNNGVARARGRLIWFVDSDDWITPKAVRRILEISERFDPDVIALDFVYSDGSVTPVPNNIAPLKVVSGSEYLNASIVQNPVQYYVYKTSFYRSRQLSFVEGLYHEDTLFTITTLMKAQRVVRLEGVSYVHHIRPGSIMTSGNHLRHATDLLEIIERLLAFKLTLLRSSDRMLLNRYIAIVSGAVFYHWRRLGLDGRRELASRVPFKALLGTVIQARSPKYLTTLALMRSPAWLLPVL